MIPNGVLVPESAAAGGREHRIVFAGRQEPRKGLQVLLRAWPEIHARTGLRLTVAGADPLAVRLLLDTAPRLRRGDRRRRLPEPGRAHGDAAPREGARRAVDRPGELRHGADARVRVRAPRRRVGHPRLPRGADARAAVAVPPDDPAALVDAVCELVADEPRRERMGEAARALAVERYSWPTIARRLEERLRERHGDRPRGGASGMKLGPARVAIGLDAGSSSRSSRSSSRSRSSGGAGRSGEASSTRSGSSSGAGSSSRSCSTSSRRSSARSRGG